MHKEHEKTAEWLFVVFEILNLSEQFFVYDQLGNNLEDVFWIFFGLSFAGSFTDSFRNVYLRHTYMVLVEAVELVLYLALDFDERTQTMIDGVIAFSVLELAIVALNTYIMIKNGDKPDETESDSTRLGILGNVLIFLSLNTFTIMIHYLDSSSRMKGTFPEVMTILFLYFWTPLYKMLFTMRKGMMKKVRDHQEANANRRGSIRERASNIFNAFTDLGAKGGTEMEQSAQRGSLGQSRESLTEEKLKELMQQTYEETVVLPPAFQACRLCSACLVSLVFFFTFTIFAFETVHERDYPTEYDKAYALLIVVSLSTMCGCSCCVGCCAAAATEDGKEDGQETSVN